MAATADQSSAIRWWNGSNVAIGAAATSLGTGFTNTNRIISVQGAPATSYAAGLARAYKGGGYSDWYLPSKDELNKLYINRAAIGGFRPSGSYWSSSEIGAGDPDSSAAWFQDIPDGGFQFGMGRSETLRVRAVRSF